MANITANRIGVQLDLTGPAFAVCAEEASGSVALDLAVRALRAREIDAALVGAVDLSDEPVHCTAAAGLGLAGRPADAAVVLVVKRLADARRDGDRILATVSGAPDGEPDLLIEDGLAELFGAPHAARGLLGVAAAAVALHHRAAPRTGRRAEPRPYARTADVVTTVLDAPPHRIRLHAADTAAWAATPPPGAHVYSGADRAGVLAAAADGTEGSAGPARLAVLAHDPTHLAAQLAAARQWLTAGGPRPDGVAFRATPLGGETAWRRTPRGDRLLLRGVGRARGARRVAGRPCAGRRRPRQRAVHP